KAVVVGAWWWTSVARAERSVAEAPVAPDLFAKSRGFRELLEAVRQRSEELDRREQALATREAAVKAMEQALAETAGRVEGGGGGGDEGAGGRVALLVPTSGGIRHGHGEPSLSSDSRGSHPVFRGAARFSRKAGVVAHQSSLG